MGNYNAEYENYYRNFNGVNKNSSYSLGGNSTDKIVKKIMQDLIGTLVLFMFAFGCKVIPLSSARYAFNYSKKIVNENYDYKKIISYIYNYDYKSINLKSIEKTTTDFMEKVQSKISGKETTEQWIKRLFIKPASGKITSGFGYRKDPISGEKKFHSGVDIDLKENTDVKAAFDGIVKDTGNDKELGNYVIVNNGKDVETKYGHLNQILTKKGDKLSKGKVIGKSGNTGRSTGPHLHFEILIMGEARDPLKYLKFN